MWVHCSQRAFVCNKRRCSDPQYHIVIAYTLAKTLHDLFNGVGDEFHRPAILVAKHTHTNNTENANALNYWTLY